MPAEKLCVPRTQLGCWVVSFQKETMCAQGEEGEMGIDITLAMCSVDPFGFLGMLVCGRARGPEYRPVATWGLIVQT